MKHRQIREKDKRYKYVEQAITLEHPEQVEQIQDIQQLWTIQIITTTWKHKHKYKKYKQ